MPHATPSSSNIFLLAQKETHSLLYQPLVTISRCCISLNLSILYILYKWKNIICGLWCLISFTKHNIFKTHSHCDVYQSFVPFYDSKYSIVWI